MFSFPLLRGAALIDEGLPRRVPASATERWPADTIEAARVPAGVHLGFTGTATAVEIDIETGARLGLATPAEHSGFVTYAEDRRVGVVPVDSRSTATVRIELPPRSADAIVRIYLPERDEPRVLGIRPIGGTVTPLADAPRWLAYGDSITQGWTTSDPGASWTAVAARRSGLDLRNLGFAGAARGELPLASHLASAPAEVISLAWGTNCWAQIEMDAPYIAQLVRLFLSTVRTGHPDTPILVVSPVLRPRAERQENGAGATLAELRDAIEIAVDTFQNANGDTNLHLLPGAELITEAELDADGIHPNDAGHAHMGAVIGAELLRLTA